MATYKLIASSVASGGAVSSVAFTSIPSTYTDLVLTCSWRGSSAGADAQLWLSINNTSYANIPLAYLQTGGTPVGGGRVSANWIVGGGNSNGSTAGVFTPTLVYITNYASTDKYKTFIIDNFMTGNVGQPTQYNYTEAVTKNFQDTSTVISSLNLKVGSSDNLMQYSSFYLYGISNA
jgi:hypothetical protein